MAHYESSPAIDNRYCNLRIPVESYKTYLAEVNKLICI